jgi:hypothetical protein
VVDLDLALPIAELDAKSDVCRKGFRFLLYKRRHDGHQNLALGVKGVNVLLLKKDGNVQPLQFSRIFQALCRIAT